ncbi:hypothetical protein C9975_10810, partial [Thalassospira xiamenensis]
MEQRELDELMTQLASDAEVFAEKEYEMTLAKNVASFRDVDDLVDRVVARAESDVLDDKALFTLANVFGAYVGEIVKAEIGGVWVYDTSDAHAPAVYLALGDKQFPFASMVYQRLIGR